MALLSYTGSRNLYGDLTNNSTAANLTLGDTLINAKLSEIYGMRDWYFLYKSSSADTVPPTIVSSAATVVTIVPVV